ncbi:MAG: Fe-S cluster assembly protein SufD [Bacteroidota bacterium]
MAIAIDRKTADLVAKYRTLFDLREQQMNGQRNHPLQAIRRQAMKQLEATGFPHRKDEDYKYTNVSKIVKQSFVEAKGAVIGEAVALRTDFDDLDTYKLVFVNGVLNREFSNFDNLAEGLYIGEMKEAYEISTFQRLIDQHLTSDIGQNAFVAMNTALAQNGMFVGVAKGTVVDKPIHISNIVVTGGQAVMVHPQLLMITEDNTEVNLVETYSAVNDGSYFTNTLNRIVVGKNAHVHHYKLQNESVNAFQINNSIATQERDSTYSSYVLDLGGRTVRNNLSSHLQASGTNTNLFGVYLADGEQHIDNQSFIDHAHPHCESNELYKGIIDGKGRGVFNGKVNVRQDAQKTNAFQQNSSLVLSNTATMDTKPQLEIFADDVKCSHGATIGQMDETSIYYLRTRGMNLEQARSMLQFAFVAEVLENFKLEAVKEKALGMMREKLG